ncbi:hypothetical protein [Roseibium limicola]|uniref:Cytochrome c domain-containing protein n=1 Tax=Roseibium limicola TaxID=2816037 RepID=A0A939ELQ9_9HYPH|nr:hypothetical protein [Roseibium limicola]MBO0345025.1 hypothetical protein [Roseibium limicola]
MSLRMPSWSRKTGHFVAVTLLLSSSALLAVSAQAQDVSNDAQVQAGYALSRQHCARCHIINSADRFTGHASTPSFMIMITALRDWPDRFDTFMARNPHPAHIRLEGAEERPDHLPSTITEVMLTLDDLDDILTYVDNLAVELDNPRPE